MQLFDPSRSARMRSCESLQDSMGGNQDQFDGLRIHTSAIATRRRGFGLIDSHCKPEMGNHSGMVRFGTGTRRG